MDRRTFIRASGLAAIAAGETLAGPARAQGVGAPALGGGIKEVRLVSAWPRGLPGLSEGAERLARRITAISGGRLRVKAFPAGEPVPASGCFDSVASGNAEMYHAAESMWDKRHKAFPFFASVPLGMTAHELSAWVHFGGGQALWDELSARFGIKAMLAGNSGVQMGGWYKEPIQTLAQIKALKMRIPGLGGEVIERLGGEASNLDGPEILPAIKSGRLNAAEWIGPWNDRELGLQTLLRHYMFPGFHEPGTGISLGVNKAFWDDLSAEEQEIVKSAAAAENDVMTAQFNARNAEALAALTGTDGVTLSIFPKEVWSQIARVAQEVVLEIGRADPLADRILRSWAGFQKRVSEWQQISDVSYTAYRALALKY
ncbi:MULTISPECIES: ABC transporter substrate-binding protein [Rhodomicrobium]|uniref:TRAP transporter substrate-binding protein n=1 Tax=Rhodomicrobium TaxID=1068 RepID=UPI000B4B22FF|nr:MULTISPECIES: ABC transporter substrate-binding protein [Rhodomicrobium]